MISKAISYLKAASVRGGPNLRGLPLVPKSLWRSAPRNRGAFNQFILWIDRLALPSAEQVVDVGANHGDFAQAAAVLYPASEILLVEPLPMLHPELERRGAERGRRWSLARCALGSEPGAGLLHLSDSGDDIGTLAGFSEEYEAANPNAQPGKAIQCEVRTLDDLCADRGIGRIDLLKIDVEGFEFEVLAGAASMLAKTTAVIVELSLIRRTGETDALERMLELLRLKDFSLVEIHPSLFDPAEPWRPLEFNLLARRKLQRD